MERWSQLKTKLRKLDLVSCPRNSRYIAGGQLAVFQGGPSRTGGKAPISESYGSIRRGGGKTANWPRPRGSKSNLTPQTPIRQYADPPTRSPRDLQVPAAFLLLKARFFKVEQELESSQHGIADGPAISQVDQSSPLYSNQFALERN
jgi:hypothetical protein